MLPPGKAAPGRTTAAMPSRTAIATGATTGPAARTTATGSPKATPQTGPTKPGGRAAATAAPAVLVREPWAIAIMRAPIISE
jgi:hypothetical protein